VHRLGASAKVINSVLQDGVVVGDGCIVQNSTLCCNAKVEEKAIVKDCQVVETGWPLSLGSMRCLQLEDVPCTAM